MLGYIGNRRTGCKARPTFQARHVQSTRVLEVVCQGAVVVQYQLGGAGDYLHGFSTIRGPIAFVGVRIKIMFSSLVMNHSLLRGTRTSTSSNRTPPNSRIVGT